MTKPKRYGITLSIRFPEDLYARLKEEAAARIRSLNEQAVYWIIKGIKNETGVDESYANHK